MSLSTSLAGVASKVIKKFGVKCTFTQETETSFDPATGVRGTTSAAFVAYGVKDTYTKEEIDDTSVQSSDIKLIIEEAGFVPQIDDTCLIGSTSYRVMDVTPIDPTDEKIIYELQLRI